MNGKILMRVMLAMSGALLSALTHADTTKVKVQGSTFINTATNAVFTIRGANYTKLANGGTHVLFSPGTYDAASINSQLANIRSQGYNVVRVFVDSHEINGTSSTQKLNSTYVSNVSQFISLAKNNSLYVTLAVPNAPWTYTSPGTDPNPICNGSMNQLAMTSSMVYAKRQYVVDLINAVRTAGAPMDNIFAYDIENEFFYLRACTPINVTPAYDPPCGTASPNPIWKASYAGTFDVNTKCGWQQIQDANMVAYINGVAGSIKIAHPQALVTMGFFSQTLDMANQYSTRAYWAYYSTSPLDFVSFHFNLSPSGITRDPALDWRQVWTNSSLQTQMNGLMEGSGNTSSKPIVMEEFYMAKSNVTNAVSAAYMARDAQIQACSWAVGRKVRDSLFWTWNTTDPDNNSNYFWSMVDNNGGINYQLSPNIRPDPCVTQ
jgi:hypothetical protein